MPATTSPECMPILIFHAMGDRALRSASQSIISSPASARQRAWSGFGSGKPETARYASPIVLMRSQPCAATMPSKAPTMSLELGDEDRRREARGLAREVYEVGEEDARVAEGARLAHSGLLELGRDAPGQEGVEQALRLGTLALGVAEGLPEPEMRADARDHLFLLERLRHVVHRPRAETLDLVLDLVQGRDEDDGDIRGLGVVLEMTDRLEAVHAGHLDVEE